MRANIIVAVGIVGSKEDCRKFMELMRADFEHRCREAAEEIMDGRIEILPMPEVEVTKPERRG